MSGLLEMQKAGAEAPAFGNVSVLAGALAASAGVENACNLPDERYAVNAYFLIFDFFLFHMNCRASRRS